MINLDLIAEQLFNSVKSRYQNLTIGDAAGDVTNIPTDARFFDFDFDSNGNSIGKVSVSLDEDDGVTIMYNKDMIDEEFGIEKDNWFTFLKDMRMFSKKRLLKFEVRDINRTNLQRRDYKFLAQNRSGDNTMAESKMYGNHKTSYQKIGSAKIAIKHSGHIGEDESRNKKIGSIFIEANGERFKYPYKHLSGARALATHVSEGGHPFDDFGKYITSLSEELSKLRKFNQYVGRNNVMAETLSGYGDIVKERVNNVKKEIANLQKPAIYKEALDNFVKSDLTEVPSEVAENWIDQLTVKQFNEELKDVFPYVYRLIGEMTQADDVYLEDIISEGNRGDQQHMVKQGETLSGIAQMYKNTSIEDIMQANGITNPKQLRAGEAIVIPTYTEIGGMASGSTRGIDPKDAYGDDWKKLTQSTYESKIDNTFEKLLGQFSDEINTLYQPVNEGGGMNAENDQEGEYYNDDLEGTIEWEMVDVDRGFGSEGQDFIATITTKDGETRELEGRELEDAEQHVRDDMQGAHDDAGDAQYHAQQDDRQEGNAYAKKVRQAKMNGAKKGDKIDGPDGDEITLEKDQKTPLGEFILSYFDRGSGQFPKGETAVLTMVEKDYGSQYVRPAQQFIERIDGLVAEVAGYREVEEPSVSMDTDALNRIRSLAGM